MRKITAFNKGKKDGMDGKEAKPVGGKTTYLLGYQQGLSEYNQKKLIKALEESHK